MSTVRVGVTKDSDDDAFDCSWEAIHDISAWRGSSTEECLILFEFSVAECREGQPETRIEARQYAAPPIKKIRRSPKILR
jgi:hypothetical protein